jgi:leader peptidase (prepilin peptidase)/N-methyltransferase
MPGEAAVLLLLILLGPAVGSFLAVLLDRLPRDEDIVARPSSCRSCGAALSPFQMIPIVSFAVQRGRCGKCGAGIPPWLLYTELLCLGAGVLAVLQGGDLLTIILSALFLWLLVALSMGDLLWFRLFDLLTACLAVVTFSMAFTADGMGLMLAFWGAVIGAGSFAALRMAYQMLRGRAGLGLGDVKLMVGLGAFVGPYDLPLLVLMAALAALGVALIQRVGAPGSLAADRPLPFGTALCAAAAVMWLIGPQLYPVTW